MVSSVSNINNSIQQFPFICAQLNGFKYSIWLNSTIWPINRTQKVLTLQVRVDLGVMIMKEYSTFCKEQFYVISRTLVGRGLTLLLRYNWQSCKSDRYKWINIQIQKIQAYEGWLVGWFLWHISPCGLFYGISALVSYFYGISALVSCLYIYIKYIWCVNKEIVDNILNKLELICSHSVE